MDLVHPSQRKSWPQFLPTQPYTMKLSLCLLSSCIRICCFAGMAYQPCYFIFTSQFAYEALIENEQMGDLADPIEGQPCYQIYTKSFYENIRSLSSTTKTSLLLRPVNALGLEQRQSILLYLGSFFL